MRDAFNDFLIFCLSNCKFGICIENMHVVHIEDHSHFVVDLVARAWVDPGYEIVVTILEINKYFIPHQLGYINSAFDGLRDDPGRCEVRVVNIFWSHPKYDFFVCIRRIGADAFFGDLDIESAAIYKDLAVIFTHSAREEIHCG